MENKPEKTVDRIPLSVNFRKLQRYNLKYFTLDEIVLFEYLIVLAQNFGHKQFYHSQISIEQETGLKRSRQEKIIQKFKSKGILDVEVKGMPKVKWFRLDFEIIKSLLPFIYKPLGNNQQSDGFYKMLTDYYIQLVENSRKSATNNLQENTNKNIKERIIKDEQVNLFNIVKLTELPFKTTWFAKAWESWIKYLEEKERKPSASTMKTQLSLLSKHSEQTAVAMINQSIGRGWISLQDVKPDQIAKLAKKPPSRNEFWNEQQYLGACKIAGVEPEPYPQPETLSELEAISSNEAISPIPQRMVTNPEVNSISWMSTHEQELSF